MKFFFSLPRSQYKVPVAQTVTVDPFKEVKEYLFQASEYSNNLKDKIGVSTIIFVYTRGDLKVLAKKKRKKKR